MDGSDQDTAFMRAGKSGKNGKRPDPEETCPGPIEKTIGMRSASKESGPETGNPEKQEDTGILKDDPFSEIVAKIQDKGTVCRSFEIERLTETHDPRAVAFLIPLLDDPNPFVRIKSAEALGRFRDARAVAALVARLNDSEGAVRRTAVMALGEIRDPRATGPLAGTVGDGDTSVRAYAVLALAQIGTVGNQGITESIGKFLKDPDPKVRQSAGIELAKQKEPAVTGMIIDLLRDNDADIRYLARLYLVEHGDEADIPRFSAVINDIRECGDPAAAELAARAREFCVIKLGSIGTYPVTGPLVAALRDPYGFVRAAAAFCLGEIGDEGAEKNLLEALNDEEEQVRYAAGLALDKISQLRRLRDDEGDGTERLRYFG